MVEKQERYRGGFRDCIWTYGVLLEAKNGVDF